MPFDSAKLDELKANIAFARKRPLAFGICLGKSPETTVLLNHKTKEPEAVGRQAKIEGETTKLAFGMMSVEGKNLNLSIDGEILAGLARKTKEMLKAVGLKMKVCILDAEGNLLEEDGDADEDAPRDDAHVEEGLDPPDPHREKWVQVQPRIADMLAKAANHGRTDLTEPEAVWEDALAKAAAKDFAGAMQAAAATAKLIAAAVEATRAVEAERARWNAAAEKLRTIIGGLGDAVTPEVKKVTALWSFAQSKAAAPVPDFAAALKVASLIVKFIAEIRAKAAPAGSGQGGGSSAAPSAAPVAAPPPQSVNGAPPVTPDENARLASLSDEDLMKTDLTLGDTKALFNEDYMYRLKDVPLKGEGNPSLKKLMQEIVKGISGPRRAEVMEELSGYVGVPPTAEKLDADYGRFLVVRKQQAANGKKQKKKVDQAPDDLDEEMHPDFMGSRSQLMFGKVLGDAFGIHEVFAALLSPTGGLVGPGNWAMFKGGPKALHLDPDNPVGLHGTVHDAAGYLLNFHDEGPGYNYRDSKIEILGTDSPLSGQVSGIAFWVNEVGADYAKREAKDAAMAIEKGLKSARDATAAQIDKAIAEAKKKAEQVVDAAKKIAEAAAAAALNVADAIADAARKAEDSATEAFEAGADKLGEIKDDAKKKLEAAWNMIWD